MLRTFCIVALLGLSTQATFAQVGSSNSGALGTLFGRGKSSGEEMQYFQTVLHRMNTPESRERDQDKKWFNTYLDRLRALRPIAKAGKISKQLQPVKWSYVAGSGPRSKDKIAVVFQDADQKAAELARIDACIERLKADQDLMRQGDAVVLKPLDLKSELGLLYSARLIESLSDTSQLWEVNDVPIVITGFDIEKEGWPTSPPNGSKDGNWRQFSTEVNTPVPFARSGEKEVEIDGAKKSVPAFRFVPQKDLPAEGARLKKKLLILTESRYGLLAPE